VRELSPVIVCSVRLDGTEQALGWRLGVSDVLVELVVSLLLTFGDRHEELALVAGVGVELGLGGGEFLEDVWSEFKERSLEEWDLWVHFKGFSFGVLYPWDFILGKVQWHQNLLFLPLKLVE
jgi:hypothetical protein